MIEEAGQRIPSRVLPAPADPVAVARVLAGEYDRGKLAFWNDDFYRHAGPHWEVEDKRIVRGYLYRATEAAVYLAPASRKEDETETTEKKWAPSQKKIGDVQDALIHAVLLRSGDRDRVMAFTNGVLDRRTRELSEHTPDVFNLESCPYEYDPAATCPRWMRFLDEVLPGAPEDQMFLQEWFGYVLGNSTDIHKIACIIGDKRSGKGTVLRVLAALIGVHNATSGSLDTLVDRFGLEPLIGKSLVTFGDIRWNNNNVQGAIQRMLEISGEDRQSIQRKGRPNWDGALGTRIMFAGNHVPRFSDSSGAFANRLHAIRFSQSFLGREDPGLTRTLLGELPGICNWALDGLDRIERQGRFSESASAAAMRGRVAESSDPRAGFFEEYVTEDPEGCVTEDALMEAYAEWLERIGRKRDGTTAETLRDAVLERYPHAENSKDTRRSVRVKGKPRKVRAFRGVRLTEWPAALEDGLISGDLGDASEAFD